MKQTVLVCLAGLGLLAGCPDTTTRLATRNLQPDDGILRPTHASTAPQPSERPASKTPAVVRMAQLQTSDELNRATDSTGMLEQSDSELRRLAETNPDPIPLRNLHRNERPAPASPASPLPTPVAPVGLGNPVSRPAPHSNTPGERLVSGATMRVNHQILTVDDILEGLHMELAEIPETVTGEAFSARVAEILRKKMAYDIQQRLVYAEAKDRLADNIKAYVDEELTKLRREMIAQAGSIEALRQKCRAEGTTLESLMAVQRRAMTVRMYLQSKFAPQIIVNRRALWNYYTTHKEKFSTKKKVQMQVLRVSFSQFLPPVSEDAQRELAEAKHSARARIQTALQAIQNGMSFTDAVAKYSDGPLKSKQGIWPMMAKGNKAEAKVEQAAFNQPTGSISDTIEEPSGLFLVKTVAAEGGVVTPFESAQGEIEQRLREEQYTRLQEAYFKKLYERAIIDTPKEFILQAIQRAHDTYRPTDKKPRKAPTDGGRFRSSW